MEATELRELLTPAGLTLLDSVGAQDASTDVVRAVSELRRAGYPPALVAAVLTQARLRTKARAKFGPFADRMLFTEAGLEQATRLRVAAGHAGRFRDAGLVRVADLGCGIGADALAMAAIDLEVTAVDVDEVTSAVAAYNLAPWPDATVVHADATAFDLTGFDAAWVDPARRSDGRRLPDPADWSPSLDFAFTLPVPAGIKLGPGIDRSLLPAGTEAQWVSVGRDVVEVVVWTGALARPGVGRAALVLGVDGAAELTSAADSEDEGAGDLGEFLLEPDGAVIRARLIGDLARRVDGRMLDTSIAYVTADAATPTPFGTWFRVREEFPLDEKVLRRELRARGIGTLEIKKRGIDVDPAVLRTRLAPKGPGAATLVLTRVGGRRRALLADRVEE
jgi:SAM-dependent methyltransferase